MIYFFLNFHLPELCYFNIHEVSFSYIYIFVENLMFPQYTAEMFAKTLNYTYLYFSGLNSDFNHYTRFDDGTSGN